MNKIKSLSLRAAITRILIMSTVSVLLVATLILSGRALLTYDDSIYSRLTSVSSLLEHNLVAPLVFNDEVEVAKTLESLQGEPNIVEAAVFDHLGKVVAVHSKVPKDQAFDFTQFSGKTGRLDTTNLCHNILQSEKLVGSICLRHDEGIIAAELKGLLLLILAVLFVGVAVAFALGGLLQRPITKSLSQFMEIINSIQRSDGYAGIQHSQLLEPGPIEELNLLKVEFHRMLDVVQEKEDEILNMNKNLEGLVSARTAELEAERATAVERSKLASLGEMAGGIAHEINNPLAIILGYTQQMKARIDAGRMEPEKLSATCVKITDTVERMAKIVKGLRAFARDGASDPIAPASVKSIISETLAFCEQRIKNHGIQLRLEIQDIQLQCRAVQISQVILNLLNNAVDAIEGSKEPWIEISSREVGDWVEILVTDSGPGIPAEIADKILQPFFTTKPVGKGTGLGLAIIVGIVKNHKGQFSLDRSSPNTRFVLKLPKTHAKTESPQAA